MSGVEVAIVAGIMAIALMNALPAEGAGKPAGMSLAGCEIEADQGQPSYVVHALGELKGYLKEVGGPSQKPRITIAIGPEAAAKYLGHKPSAEKVGEEGYIVRSAKHGGRNCVVVSGASPKGTKFGIYGLMKMIRVERGVGVLDAGVDITTKPDYALRGMHLNGWPFNYPYAFRVWPMEDWQRYIDMLSTQGVNLLYIWPFMEIIPVPVSKEDEEYLLEFRKVVEYAQREHGMEVWMMQSANRVAESNCGVADPRKRPYWRMQYQVDMNPGDPAQFAKIMQSREALYRIVNNVDGVVTIDCDPGGWPGAPVSDWAKIINGCRGLLDKHNIHGRKAKLINWLHLGWGRTTEVRLDYPMGDIIKGLEKDCIDHNMYYIAGWPALFPMCADAGVIGRTVALPYSTIEGEPTYPKTVLDFDRIGEVFKGFEPLKKQAAGGMGNAQCPLLQLPNVHYFLSCLWNSAYDDTPMEKALLDLSQLVYPEAQTLLADCYAAIKKREPEETLKLADRLEAATKQDKLGKPGVVGRELFPDKMIVAKSLVLQLRMWGAQETLFRNYDKKASTAELRDALYKAMDAYMTWDEEHGWHGLWHTGWPIPSTPLVGNPRLSGALVHLRQLAGSEAEMDRVLDSLEKELASHHDPNGVKDYCTKPVRDTAHSIQIWTLAQQAKATASATPNFGQYPPSCAIDGSLETQYWPGALVTNNTEWFQLTWKTPQTIKKVVAHFLKHPSMVGRTIHLQRETQTDKWEDVATTVVPDDASAKHAVATFELSSAVTVDKLRIVNLLDLYEVEVL